MPNNKVKPLTIEIDKDLWEKFKNSIPRTKRLNDALVELIKKAMKEK